MDYHSRTRHLEECYHKDGFTYAQVRGAEQVTMISLHLLRRGVDTYQYNQINGISPLNPNLVFYLASVDYISNYLEDEALNAFGWK